MSYPEVDGNSMQLLFDGEADHAAGIKCASPEQLMSHMGIEGNSLQLLSDYEADHAAGIRCLPFGSG